MSESPPSPHEVDSLIAEEASDRDEERTPGERVRHKRSHAWRHLKEHGDTYQCPLCAKSWPKEPEGCQFNISNFSSHFRNKHTVMARELGFFGDTAPPINTDDDLHESILAWLLDSCRPFVIVEDPGFRNLMQRLSPNTRLLKADQLVDKYFQRVIDSRLAELGKTRTSRQVDAFSITVDTWSSQDQKHQWLAITTHYISSDWQIHHELVSLTAPPQCSSPAELHQVMEDAVSYMQRAGRPELVGLVAGREDAIAEAASLLESTNNATGLHCVCHRLVLVIAKIFELCPGAYNLREKCSEIVNQKSSSHLFQELNGTPRQSLASVIDMGWSSNLAMFNCFLKSRDTLESLWTSERYDGLVLDDEEWDNVSRLSTLLSWIAEQVDALCTDKRPTLHEVLPRIWMLYQVSNETRTNSDHPLEAEMHRAAVNGLREYFPWCGNTLPENDELDRLAAAAFLDPRRKDFDFVEEEEFRRDLSARAQRYMKKNHLNTVRERPVSSSSSYYNELAKKKRAASGTSELDSYVERPEALPESEEFDVLEYWCCSPFSALRCVARRVLCVPASSITSARVFSLVDPYLRRRLSPQRLHDAIIFVANKES